MTFQVASPVSTIIRAGQTWRPVADAAPGVGQVRIICRYPFATPEDGPVWIIEFLHSISRLDKVTEETLTELWRLEADVDPH
jgi:hypothetical protein